MKVYFGKDRQCAAQHARATHATATATELARKTDRRGHKLFWDNMLSSPELFDDLAKNRFTVAVLSGQTEEASHKTALKTKKEKGRHSLKNQGRLDGNSVSGQERYTRADEYSQLPSERNFLQ
jgi:hypothetical protein